MECVYSRDEDDDAAVTAGSATGSWVRLWNRVDPWGDGSIDICVQVAVETAAEHLRAEAHGVTIGVMGGENLSPFLDRLVENFEGWEVSRVGGASTLTSGSTQFIEAVMWK